MKFYYYIFYKFYKFSEASPSRWWSEWKAGLVLIVLQLWLIASVIIYLGVLLEKRLMPSVFSPIAILTLTILILINWRLIHYNNRWKGVVKELDQMPKKKSRIIGIWVWVFVMFVIANLVFSFYVLSQSGLAKH